MAEPVRLWLARLLALVVAVALPVALLSAWTAVTVGDTDQYVDTVAPLADDEAVRVAVEERLESAALAALARHHPALADVASSLLRPVVVGLVESDSFPPVWTAANRAAHETLLDLLAEDPSGEERVAVDLGPLVDAVWKALADEGLPVGESPGLPVSIVLVQASELEKARTAFEVLDTLGLLLPLACALLALLALVLSPRRWGVLAVLGWGALVGSAVLFVAVRLVRGQLVDGVRATDADLAAAVFDQVVSGLDRWVLATAVAGALAVVAWWVRSGLARRRPTAA